MPESLKYIAAPILRDQLLNSVEFCEYYRLLVDREVLSPESIKEYQFSQLKQILIHSYQNVPYYRELFNNISFNPDKFADFEEMDRIPFLTREIVTDKFDKLISRKKINGGYYIGTTGGSSGSALRFLLDYNSIFKENAFIYYFRKKTGYNFKDKLVTFRQIEFGNRLWKLNPMHNELIFSAIRLSKVTIKDYVKQIEKFAPQYLNGYLSTIWYFTKLLEEYGIKLNTKLTGILLISENIDNNQRKFIEQFFNVKSTTFYGHSERCVIAEELAPNLYRFDPYYGFTEQIPLEENRNLIVGTGFLNLVMPFIRYKTDDVCSKVDEFYTIEGKRSSSIGLYGYNGEFLSSTAFDLEDPLFKNITTYQFIQNEIGRADLLIVVNSSFHMSELEHIKKEIFRLTKGIVDINIKLVDHLILSPRGKYQMYISNIGKK